MVCAACNLDLDLDSDLDTILGFRMIDFLFYLNYIYLYICTERVFYIYGELHDYYFYRL